MAVWIRDGNPSGISVEEVITGAVYSVVHEDDVRKALELMQEHKVRRLPVVSAEGELKGMLSMNGVVLKSEEARDTELAYADVVNTYKAICAHSLPMQLSRLPVLLCDQSPSKKRRN